jgi:BirA family biotin operon repressor/biotin-[acetyl-CoA-carboxylase] ligase
LLLEASEALPVSVLAMKRKVTAASVLGELDRLRQAGCTFDEHPQHGLKLIEAGFGAWVDYLQSLFDPPRRVEFYRQTSSTQDVCRRMVHDAGRASDGAIVIADEQTAGRGRLGRSWIAPPGSALTYSTIRVLDEHDDHATDRLTFAASVVLARALDEFLPTRLRPAKIKWPNDVMVDGRKIAGILVETLSGAGGVRAAIVGIGVNVRMGKQGLGAMPADLRGKITSLSQCAVQLDRLRLCARLVVAMEHALRHERPSALLEQWRQRCAMLHQHVRLRSNGQAIEGEVVDLDPHEGLIVRTAGGALLHLPAAVTTVL